MNEFNLKNISDLGESRSKNHAEVTLSVSVTPETLPEVDGMVQCQYQSRNPIQIGNAVMIGSLAIQNELFRISNVSVFHNASEDGGRTTISSNLGSIDFNSQRPANGPRASVINHPLLRSIVTNLPDLEPGTEEALLVPPTGFGSSELNVTFHAITGSTFLVEANGRLLAQVTKGEDNFLVYSPVGLGVILDQNGGIISKEVDAEAMSVLNYAKARVFEKYPSLSDPVTVQDVYGQTQDATQTTIDTAAKEVESPF